MIYIFTGIILLAIIAFVFRKNLKKIGFKIPFFEANLETHENLKEEKDNSKIQPELKTNLDFRNGACWAKGDDEPFCSKCWEVDKKTVHMHAMGNPAWYECPNCKSSVLAKPYLDKPATAHVHYTSYK